MILASQNSISGQPESELVLEIENLDVEVFTGIYSEEVGLPQPLRISICARRQPTLHFGPNAGCDATTDYMTIKAAINSLATEGHFTLVEAVADRLAKKVFDADVHISAIKIKIVKLALSEGSEEIGITLCRTRAT